jgi:hypothetical protein
VVVVLTQAKPIAGVDRASGRAPRFRGGSTLIVDLTSTDPIKYRIIKNVQSKGREERTATFVKSAMADPLRALLVAPAENEQFFALHSLTDEEPANRVRRP